MSSPSPTRRLNLNLGGSTSQSPTRGMRSPAYGSQKTVNTLQDQIRKEQEKIAKRAAVRVSSADGEEEEEQDFEEKHPFIQAVIDRENYNKKYLAKSTQKPNLKEMLRKEKNLITDLPDPLQSTLYNGVECQLKQAFETVIFFVGNYIALYNVIRDETKYIGIDANLSEITAFEVLPFDIPQKQQSPIRNTQPNLEGFNSNTNETPLELKDLKMQPSLTMPSTNSKELLTLVAFAERAKETYLKETKFNTRKVYGITNSKNKRGSVDIRSPSPTKSPKRTTFKDNELANNEDFGSSQNKYLVKVNVFTLNNPDKKFVLQHYFDEYFYVQQIYMRDKESLCYTLCSNSNGEQIFFIWNFRKEIVLGFVEMEYKINKFVVTQKSEMILFLGEYYLKYHEINFTNKMIKENSMNIIPMKIEKESNFIDMEYIPNKGNNEMFVLITDNNSIFIYEKNTLKHKLFNQFRDPESCGDGGFDSIMSDALEIGELSDRENIGKGEDHLRIRSKGTNIKEGQQQQQHHINAESTLNLNTFQKKMQMGSSSQVQSEAHKDEDNEFEYNQNLDVKFQRLIVTHKGFYIGSANGYILSYEFKNDYEPKLMNKVHISNKIRAVASMSISRNNFGNDDFMVALAGVYQKKMKKSNRLSLGYDNENNGSAQGNRKQKSLGRNFFMPQVIHGLRNSKTITNRDRGHSFDHRKRLSQASLGASQSKFNQVFDDNNCDFEEKVELLIVNMKAIQTQQYNKIVEKVFQKGVHDGSIFQIAQCKNKSTFYTISENQNLKVWNHTNEWKSSASYTFDEQPLCIDVHPSSWQIAVGFKSGLKIYQSLDKEIKLSFEKLGKAAFAVSYSEGGNLLACTNAVYIDIIDPIRMQIIMTLFGHKGLVKQLSWTLNGKFLISSCSNGGLYFWRGNFKEQVLRNVDNETIPIGQLNDKSYLYISLAYDDDLDTIIALTSTSTLRLFINNGQDPIHEEDLLSLPSNLEAVLHQNQNFKATCMAFSKSLGIIAVGHSNGKCSLIQWPMIPNKKPFKYDIFLQSSAITDIKFSHMSRYLMTATDDGNFYVLETYKIIEGVEKTWVVENQERLQLQKKRETNNLSGFSVVDNIVMSNKEVLQNVNRKIERLRTMKKSQEINHEIKKKKTEKRYDKQMKLIEKELNEELQKQGRSIGSSQVEFKKEKDNLERILGEQMQEHKQEKEVLITSKETNLNFVANENDELETKILRLKETIVEELEKIEEEHQEAVNDLVSTYEESVKLAQDEVKSTIEKLKQNGAYYENMVLLQEKDYEQEVQKLQGDLIQEHTELLNKKENLMKKHDDLRDEYQSLEDNYKDNNRKRKDKLQVVRDMQGEYKYKYNNEERLYEKEIQSHAFIHDKEKSIFDTVSEKKQLENLIVFLSEKIKELKDQGQPLADRKAELQGLIEETYRELQDDYQFRKYLEHKEDGLQKQMQVIQKEIDIKTGLKEQMELKNHVFKRELAYLADAKSLRGWNHKMQGMLKCMMEVYNAACADEIKKISMAFIHIAEIMESNARPYRASESQEDNFTKQSRLNEMELAYYRNKNSEKMREMQVRYKALFGQMEKQIKKLRNDNKTLIEEFNTLINEKKKLNNLRNMIKESIKEYLGDKYNEEKYNSSDEDAYKIGGKKKSKNLKEKDPLASQQSQMGSQMMSRSKSTSQFLDKHVKVLQTNLTARESTKMLGQLPDLKASQISQISLGGSITQRDKSEPNKGAMTGFSMNKTQQLMQKRRIINSITSQKQQSQNSQDNSKYLEKIVVEFEKNKKQIEEQTKNLKIIQNLADVVMQSGKAQSTTGAVPNINLQKIKQNLDINMAKASASTRIPNTSERTKVSMNDQSQGIVHLLTKRNLPVVKERNSIASSKDDNA